MKSIFTLLVSLVYIISCRSEQSEPLVVYYRLIGEIEAFQKDGGVIYPEFIMDSGTLELQGNQLLLPLQNTDKPLRITFERNNDQVTFRLQDVQTAGSLNSWTRLNKIDSYTFGPDIDCEIWIGTAEPPEE